MTTTFHNLASGVLGTVARSRGFSGSVYSRGSASCVVTVVPAASRIESADSEGHLVSARRIDFLIEARAIVLGGVRVAPAPGDRIVVDASTDQGRHQLTYELAALPGERVSAPVDPSGTILRVHVNLIEEVR